MNRWYGGFLIKCGLVQQTMGGGSTYSHLVQQTMGEGGAGQHIFKLTTPFFKYHFIVC